MHAPQRIPKDHVQVLVYRFQVDPTNQDYRLNAGGDVVGHEDLNPAEPFKNKNGPVNGISFIELDNPSVLLQSPQNFCQALINQSLPAPWRLCYTHRMKLYFNDGSEETANHYLMYPADTITLDAFRTVPLNLTFMPYTLDEGSRRMALRAPDESESNQPDMMVIYGLIVLRELFDSAQMNVMDKLLVCDLHNHLSTQKKPLHYMSTFRLKLLLKLFNTLGFRDNPPIMDRQAQVCSRIHLIFRLVSFY